MRYSGRFAAAAPLMLLLAVSALSAERPYWWDSPHKDDADFMYERGSSSGAPDEQTAVIAAVQAAKGVIMERIGIAPALAQAGLAASPEYALVNCDVSGTGTEKQGKTWNAWVLVKYPQGEKTKMLERWNASIASIQELKKKEERIPKDFRIELGTANGRTQYRAGEEVQFTVTAAKDCYLLLLDHQSDGSSVLLFPNRFHPDGFISAGQKVLIPSPSDSSFRLLVGEPFGDDRIEAIAATSNSALHKQFSGFVRDLSAGQDFAVATRGIFVQAMDSAVSAPAAASSSKNTATLWSRAELNLSTYPQ